MIRSSIALTSVAAIAVLFAGCLDRGGLDPSDAGSDAAGASSGTGGSNGTGGAVGSGGVSASGGNSGTGATPGSGGSGAGGGSSGSGGATMCPPVCAIFCPYGNVLDAKGCATCSCNPRPLCTGAACAVACPYGYVKDANGCDICQCNPGPTCPTVACNYCPNGYVMGDNGCSTCACNPPPTLCSPTACGAAPTEPVTLVCPPSTTAAAGALRDAPAVAVPVAPQVVCQTNAQGKCTWQKFGCEACSAVTCDVACVNGFQPSANGCPSCACNPPPPPAVCAFADVVSCGGNPQCTWLQPGCVEPALATAGCYARASLGCTSDAGCGQGHQCLKRAVNPCPRNALGQLLACPSCAVVQTICQ